MIGGHVVIEATMSLDGDVTGPNASHADPMGEGGERLHDGQPNSDDERDRAIVAGMLPSIGAVVRGRRTFDLGLPNWSNTPFPVPSFVVIHKSREPLPQPSGAFTFVSEGVAHAVELGRAAAGPRKVRLMGADVSRQALAAGLVDEIDIRLVPVMLDGGTRLFHRIDGDPIEPERVRVVASPAVTHRSFRPRRYARRSPERIAPR